MSWKKLKKLNSENLPALKLGSKEKVRKQHEIGRLTVEKVSYLLDKSSFNEVGL